MKPKVIVTLRIPSEHFRQLEETFEMIWPYNNYMTREEQTELMPEAQVVIPVYNRPFDSAMMDLAPELKLIANFGAGTDQIDTIAATQRGIVVTNTPDSVTEPTAELAMGLILAITRRIPELDRQLRASNVAEWGAMDNLSNTLEGKTLGIIGMGAIGQSLAKRALAFGMKIIYHNRKKLSSEIETKYEARYTDLENLLRTANIVSLNAPLTQQTRGIIGMAELKLMKPSALLINTSRGAVVNEKDLIKALKNKEIAGAALDVFEEEPDIPKELLKMSNVVLLPHVGGGTFEARNKMAKQVAHTIEAFFNGPENLPVVNPKVLDSPSLRIKKKF